MTRTGTFVQVETSADGVGKVVEVHGVDADVEYFVSPAGARVHRVRVPTAAVREVELSPQTRVFWHDVERSAWRAGRVDGGLVSAEALRSVEDHYHVRFPNGQEGRVPVSRLYVRWAHPIEDPTDYLADRVTDTPFFFDGRSHIVRYLSNQRAAFGGLTALASSAIELLPHQVSTVRRVLADPIERYLLADEVGLGKTIEAGILIRQHVIDRPRDAHVLVVVPKHLVQQWKSELAGKFFLPSPGAVEVIGEDALGDANAATFSMLVVDEAHRSALRAFDSAPPERRLYERLRELARRTPRVLLLSGTPVLHQEDGFLAMLHLLDPEGYPLEDRDSFRRRVRDRQTIAEATADLDDDASTLFIEEAINRLGELFADDARLMELCSAVRSRLGREGGDDVRIRALRALRTHVTETYRLHRRLLRTRREDPRVRDHLPRRTGAIVVEHEDHARDESFDFLEAWRLAVTGTDTAADLDQPKTLQRLFAIWVESALSHPLVLVRRIDARLAFRSNRPTAPLPLGERELLASAWAFDGEEALLRERRQLIAASLEHDVRALQLAEWLKANREIAKVVVFVDDKQAADLIATTLKGALGGDAVIRHELGGEGARAFEANKAHRILVCDSSAEEGLNFQRFAAAVVHYDLPLEPARIEQRIGRVDRIEARGRMRNVVLTSGGHYEREWLACLTDTVRVFDRSVAPLQYVLLEATSTIRARLILEGPAAIDAEAGRMRDANCGVDAELRRIRAQEALDSVEADPERGDEFFQSLTAADEAAEQEGEDAFHSWVVARLQFARRSDGQSIRYAHDARRPTLVPLLDVAMRFTPCVDRDREARHSRTELPFQRATFERASAEKDGIGLLRVGHPFVEALQALIRADDRGAAFAMWRHVPGTVGPPQVFFRFDFVIEADITRAREVTECQRGSVEALRRRADEAFPVQYRTVWLDSDLDVVRDDRLLATLALPYSREQRTGGGKDTNLRLDRWTRVDTLVPLGDWGGHCARAREAAERLLRNDGGLRDRCQRHERELSDGASAIDDALRSRIARLVGPACEAEERAAQFERALAESLALGVSSPSLRVDSAGAIFLSGEAWVEE